MAGWIAVDLDGTLAHYEGWNNGEIGEPIPAMQERVKIWLEKNIDVRIFTARANDPDSVSLIQDWTEKHLGKRLLVTATKDFKMVELWDDRCVQVIINTGQRADGKQ